MRKLIACCLLLIASTTNAAPINETLADIKVTHLQLLANNFNMFMLNNFDSLIDSQKDKTSKTLSIRLFSTQEKTLHFTIYGESDVKSVTNATCTKSLSEIKELLTGELGAAMLRKFSYFELTQKEINELTSSFSFWGQIQADINKELSVSCSL